MEYRYINIDMYLSIENRREIPSYPYRFLVFYLRAKIYPGGTEKSGTVRRPGRRGRWSRYGPVRRAVRTPLFLCAYVYINIWYPIFFKNIFSLFF